MKLTQTALVLAATASLILAGCDRAATQAEAKRLAEERAALEREKAALATAQAAARETANQEERRRLEAERAEFDREKNKLAAERAAQQQTDQQARAAAERDARMAAERRAQEEEARQREAAARERETEDSREAQTVDFFYDALDPYGEWIELERYGYAFRPNTNQVAMWRPYTDGGWVYTEYGWTWRSNEPFGWATYHYGRWAKLPRLGWVWIPGTEWGPAWVSWRRSSDYVGWAPLPPDAWSSSGFNAGVDSYFDIGPGLYTFLRVADFGEPNYVDRVIEPERNVTIINNTVNITKTVYRVVNNRTTIVNEGPELTVINNAARRPVQQLKVQRVEAASPRGAKVESGMLEVVAPVLRKASAPAKPKQVKESVKVVEVDRGWKEAKADSQKVRAEAAREARQAEAKELSEAKAPVAVKPATPPAKSEGPRRPSLTEAPAKPEAPASPSTIPRNRPEASEGPAGPGSKPGTPVRRGRPTPENQSKPVVEPPPAIAPVPGPAPVPGAEPRPGRPGRPGKPLPESQPVPAPAAEPAPVPPAGIEPAPTPARPGRPGRPTPQVSPKPGSEPAAEPPASEEPPTRSDVPTRLQRRARDQGKPVGPTPSRSASFAEQGLAEPATPAPGQPGLKQFKRKIEQPTPIPPEGDTPKDRRLRQ
jgi:hypothetical protein